MAKLAPATQASKTTGCDLATASPCNSSIKDYAGFGFVTVNAGGAERMLNAASPPSTRPDGTQNPHVVTELQMTLDDINVIFCAVAVEVGGRFVYHERKAEENEIKNKMQSPPSVLRHRRRGKSAGCGEPPALDDTAGYAALPPSTRSEAERAPAELPISSGGG